LHSGLMVRRKKKVDNVRNEETGLYVEGLLVFNGKYRSHMWNYKNIL
jgi:hypothetical protein